MQILLTGFSGYVGTIVRRWLGEKHGVICLSSSCSNDENHVRCDLRDEREIKKLTVRIKPDLIIHAAGAKNIAFCEKNPEHAYSINCQSIVNLAQIFDDSCRIIYLSTDYVFAGNRGNYGEEDKPDPVTVYGSSKLCGEVQGRIIAGKRFAVLRASALYDVNASFPRFLYENLSRGKQVTCYSDLIYSPTYYRDFLAILEGLIDFDFSDHYLFHASGESLSRYEFALHFARAFEFNESLVVKTSGSGNDLFLFPNLSLTNDETRRLLRVERTAATNALQELRIENFREAV
jgi:dTDP-4-dehydrorhamnose reductase